MPITPRLPDSAAIRDCAAILAGAGLAIVPTDTVYGVAASAASDAAVEAIFSAKGGGRTAPLQLLFAPSHGRLRDFALLTPYAETLVDALGPGGWTIIVPARPEWSSPALAGGTTVGFRIPDQPIVHQLVEALGGPIAASSANRHGGTSPVTCGAAIEAIGDACSFALDGGRAAAGLDSTVVDCAGESPVILREGAIDRLTIARILDLPHIQVVRSVRP